MLFNSPALVSPMTVDLLHLKVGPGQVVWEEAPAIATDFCQKALGTCRPDHTAMAGTPARSNQAEHACILQAPSATKKVWKIFQLIMMLHNRQALGLVAHLTDVYLLSVVLHVWP